MITLYMWLQTYHRFYHRTLFWYGCFYVYVLCCFM